nr:disease resistance-like protein csa1 [Quercus suber]
MFSRIQKFPREFRNLRKLKLIDLSGSKNLTQTPDFNEFPNIERLNFQDHCSKLQTLPHLPLSTQFVSARGCTSLENYSNQVVVWTSGEARFTIINCLGLADDEDGKIAEVSSLDIHFQPPLWLWQRYVEDQILQIEGFCHVLRQSEIPKWFADPNFGSFAPIPLPSNLFSNRSWEGIALCVIFTVPTNLNDGSPGQDSKYFHEFFCRLVVNGDLIAFKVPKETYVGSFGLWLYISNSRFRQHLNERNSISPSIEVNSPDIKIGWCGARILYKQDMVEFVQNLRQITFGSPNLPQGHEKFKEDNMSVSQSPDRKLQSLLSELYQEDWARTHLYDYIFPQVAYSPIWFTNENWGPSIRFPLPRDYHDDSSWLGFSTYALYTIQMQRDGINYKQDSTIFLSYSSFSASDDVYFAPHKAFPLSRDIFDESSQRFVVFYIPRLLFQLNRCSHIKASFGSDDSSVQVEKCGIRLVHKQDVSVFVQTLVQYMLRSSDAYHQYFSLNLMHQLRVLKDCNHEKDYCCHFSQERWSNPMPKLLLSNGTIQEECTSRETLFSNHAIAAGTSNNSSQGSNYLGIPFVNEHCGSEISSCLECWYRPYLQNHYRVRSTSNHHYSQSEIPDCFKYHSTNRSVEISLPLNLYNNPDWMGFAFCAVFSFQKHPASVPMKLHSRFSFVIVCHLKTNLGCMNPLLWYGISEEDVIISLHQREFLWVSFIPCEFLSPKWSRCNLVEFSFVSDNSDVLALKCGVDLVYREKLEFTRTMVQCITSYDRPSTSYERFSFNHPNQFSSSDGSSGTSGHYSYECPYQFRKTAALDRCNNRSIFNQCIPQSEFVEWFSHDLLPSDLSPKFDFHPSTSYNFCFPPSKIQDWFSHPNHGHSMTIDLPSNLYHNRNWMGLVLYASFSIHGDPNIVYSNLVSGKSHFLYCQCQTSMANVDNQPIAFSTNKEEIKWLLNLGEFIWICYVPGEPFKNMLPHCTHIEASFVSDWPGVIVQNCALQLLYQHDQLQFEQELKHCHNLISQKWKLVRKQLEDQKKINEQYHVDEGLQRIIFSNIDFEVKIFPRLIDQLETDETETQLGLSDLLENQEKVDKWSVTTKEVTKISGEHLEKSQQIMSTLICLDFLTMIVTLTLNLSLSKEL